MLEFNKKFAFLLALLLAVTGCASVHLAKEADQLANAGEWDEAVLKYSELFKKEPGSLDYRMKYTRARFEAAQIHHRRGEEQLAKGNHDGALLEFQAALFLEPSLDKARSSLEKTRRLKDSLYYYGKGLEELTRGNERAAKSAFRKSVSLDPANEAASDELEKLKSQGKMVMDGFELDLKSASPIDLEFRDAGVKQLFQVISRLSGINFIFDSEVRDERTTITLKSATFKQALELVLAANRLSKKAVSENTLIIYPSTPQKAAQYEEMMIKVFYLSNSDAKQAVNLLRTMVKARDISVQEDLNAVVIRARPETIELANKVLQATDLADAELMLEVSIMEVNKTKASNLGIDLTPDSITANVPTTNGSIRLGDLANLSSSDLLMGIPAATLNIKKEDLDANLLANPKVRVRNNGKARIHIGDRVPIITTTVNQGVTTENIQYQDVGLKLTVEPTVRQNDEVDLKLSLEVSSLGTKTVTSSGSVAYQIGTRNTETELRLRDGETQVFGGLINDEERKTTAKIPLLGEVPVLGRLFSNLDKSSVKTELLLSITPRIIRKFDLPEDSETGFMSGRDDFPSAGPLSGVQYIPEETAGQAEAAPPSPAPGLAPPGRPFMRPPGFPPGVNLRP